MEIVREEKVEIKESPEVDVKPKDVIEYDPNKKYTWKPNDIFYFSGNEFGVVLNALGAVLNTQEAQTILLAERAHNTTEEVLIRAIKAGIATEIVDSKKK